MLYNYAFLVQLYYNYYIVLANVLQTCPLVRANCVLFFYCQSMSTAPNMSMLVQNFDFGDNVYICLFADIDECKTTQAGNCEHRCVNILGSYQCHCNEGYSLQQSKCISKLTNYKLTIEMQT